MLSIEEYTTRECNRLCFSNTVLDLLENLNNSRRIIFTKFGDSEAACMMSSVGANCDGDTYTTELSMQLRRASVTL